MTVKKIIAGICALLFMMFIFSSWFIVDQGDRGIVVRFGRVVDISEPGFHGKLPFIDSVRKISVRTAKANYSGAAYSKDVQTAEVSVSVNYRVDTSKIMHVYETYGHKDFLSRIVDPIVLSKLKITFGQYTAAEVVSKRDVLNKQMEEAIGLALGQTGIIIDGVQIENVDFSDSYEQAIEAAARAEAEVKQVRQQLEREKIEAEKQIEKAKGVKAMADADAYAISRKGTALRENPKLVDMTIAEKWNGVLPTTMVPGGSLPLLNLK